MDGRLAEAEDDAEWSGLIERADEIDQNDLMDLTLRVVVVSQLTFDHVFPDYFVEETISDLRINGPRILGDDRQLTPELCAVLAQLWLAEGLLAGLLLPRVGARMLSDWLDEGPRGRFRSFVPEGPKLSNLDDAKRVARVFQADWRLAQLPAYREAAGIADELSALRAERVDLIGRWGNLGDTD